MKCPNCKSSLPDDATFCPECGTNPKTYRAGDSLDNVPTPPPPEPPKSVGLEPGAVFADRYEVVRKLGQGGMGVVYVAKDRHTGGEVVLKLIHPHLVSGDEAVRRLLAEGLLARQIRHPNIVAVFDVAQSEGQPYFTMEYIKGGSLRSWLVKKKGAATDVSLPVAAGLVSNILDGLGEAHRMGVVHRDLKPENVMLVGDPDAGDLSLKILDFGIAKAVGGTKGETSGGGLLGTPLYMAPEQMTSADVVGPQADLYSISVIFYEMLMEVSPQARWEPISGSRKDVPAAIDQLIEKGLSARPRSRPASVAEYKTALGAAMGNDKPVRPVPPAPGPPQPRPQPQPVVPPPPEPVRPNPLWSGGLLAKLTPQQKKWLSIGIIAMAALYYLVDNFGGGSTTFGGDDGPMVSVSGRWVDSEGCYFNVRANGSSFSGSGEMQGVGTVDINGELAGGRRGTVTVTSARGVLYSGPLNLVDEGGPVDASFGDYYFHIGHQPGPAR